MNWFEATRVTIYILNPFTKLYCPLRNLKEIRDKSALKIFEEEAMLKSKNLMTSPYQQWRRYDSCRSSAQSIGTPHTKDLPISNQFPNQKINSNRSIRNDIMRSAPPISRELIYPDNGIYKSLFLQDPSSSSPSSSLLPAQTSSSLLPPSSSSSSSLNFVIRHESLQSSTSTNSDVSQATIVRSPYISSASLNPNKNNTNNTNNTNQITNNNTEAYNHRTANKHSDVTMETKVLKLKEQTHILQRELDQLKQLQQKHVTTMKESILEATSKCEELLTSVNKNLTRDRNTIDVQKSGYSDDVGVVEAKLKGLEFSIEELKNEVLTRRGSIKINEINKLAHLLNQVAKLLTELKIRLQILQTTIKPLILSEIVTVINDEKFVRGEPNRLDILLNRCKHLATILTTLKKLALAQENAKPASSLPQHSINCQIVSQPFTETSSCNPTPPRLKSTTNVIERSQSQQQIPTQQSVSIPSQSIDNLDQFKVNGNHHFDQFDRKVLNPQQNIDNDAYLFFMQNLYSIYTGTPFSQSSSSLARGETRVNRSLAPEVQETQSAPTTPMMVGARIPNVHFNHGCLLKNGSDISLAPSTESSRYSSPMSSESNMKRLFDTSSMNQLTDQFNRKHRQNVLFHPGYSDIGHLRNELLNELLFNSSTQINKSQLRNIGAISDSEDNFVGENHPTQFSVHDKQQQNSTKYCNLYTSLYKMLDENINKQQQQQQQNTIMSTTATTASASCLHCSTEESESPIKHKADCPLQIHEAILRFSKANSDLEMGLCAKLSRDHLQEKLKIRQDQLKKQNNDDK